MEDITVSLTPECLAILDKNRGGINRSRYIRYLIKNFRLHMTVKEKLQSVKDSERDWAEQKVVEDVPIEIKVRLWMERKLKRPMVEFNQEERKRLDLAIAQWKINERRGRKFSDEEIVEVKPKWRIKGEQSEEIERIYNLIKGD